MASTRTTPLPAAEKKRLKNLIKFEKQARLQGYNTLAGIDEAGRGPLAGPVVAAACIIPDGIFFDGVDDSKKLTAAQREILFDHIHSHPEVRFGIAIVDALEIDRINIYQATIKAMLQAVANLPVEPDYLLVDGMNLPHPHISCLKIIKGDTLSQSIAAASILAKVTRDRLMEKFHEEWPNYGFKQHKGYATEMHLEAILTHGPCPIHRMSFSPMRKEPVEAFKEQLLPFF